jgi:hypothetical protein
MSRNILVAVAFFSLGLLGCNSSSDAKKFYGSTYDMQVTAFGKMDEDTAAISEGSDGVLVFDFTYGFTTMSGDPNETGLRVKLSGDKLTIASQPIHVDYSTGVYDGTVTGTGKVATTMLTMTLDVVPMDTTIGSMVEYDVTGTQQAN